VPDASGHAPHDARHDAPHDAPRGAPRPGRAVPARAAVAAAAVTLAVGLAGGWALADARGPERWAAVEPSGVVRPAAPMAAPAAVDAPLTVVDRAGRVQRAIAATRPWTPRFSPDGRRVAYGAFGAGRSTSDLWVAELAAGTTQRLTDGDADANDPQWSPDGAALAYSAGAAGGKDVAVRMLAGGAAAPLARRDGTQFASDWLRDGSALLVTEEAGPNRHDVLVQPADGSAARPYAATPADETAARASPDGRWVAYTSDESGQAEVYLDAYPRPARRVRLSSGGGVHPVWRGDGRELYYWRGESLVAVQIGPAAGGAPPAVGASAVLFRAPYRAGPNTMYDASPDGTRFVLVREP
jgi:Tol biopolymer transport system component